jgi:glycosyltransferase involved in cell wall biosynthesis
LNSNTYNILNKISAVFTADLSSLEIVDFHKDSQFDNLLWKTILCLKCVDREKNSVTIDIRETWSEQIFLQNLYDQAWTLDSLLSKPRKNHCKIILYLCYFPIKTTDKNFIFDTVSPDFIRGRGWQSIKHVYIDTTEGNWKFNHLLTYLGIDASNEKSTILDKNYFYSSVRKEILGSEKMAHIKPSTTKITVITVVLNGGYQLEQTIQSVINQQYVNLEYIIIDGASTDSTINIIKKYSAHIDKWISEKDRGIYDAMNKGINLSTGQWLSFMNCGDIFYNCYSLSSVPLNEEVDFYYSDVIHSNNAQKISLEICSHEEKKFNHQSIVYQKKNHDHHKYLVHEKLTISDYLFFRENDNKKWCKIDIPLSIYNTEGVSANISTQFVQKVLVHFIAGDISESKIILLISKRMIKGIIKRMVLLLPFSHKNRLKYTKFNLMDAKLRSMGINVDEL